MKAFLPFVLLLATICSAENDDMKAADGSKSRTLEPWLVGLTAVVVFLVIVFIILVAKRLFKKKRNEGYDKAVTVDGVDTKQTSL